MLRAVQQRREGYRVELPEERLTATFNADSILELSPDLVGPSITKDSGIIGESVDLNGASSAAVHALSPRHEIPGEEPKLVRPTSRWLDTSRLQGRHLSRMYQEPDGVQPHHRRHALPPPHQSPVDPYGSTAHVNSTRARYRWDTRVHRPRTTSTERLGSRSRKGRSLHEEPQPPRSAVCYGSEVRKYPRLHRLGGRRPRPRRSATWS